ncbi:MAG: hypothetical protein IKY07_05320 [Clostridia bacterium]|nr:hypothetical protein [Clostridia bacterium]
MKKLLAIAICIALCLALAVPAFAESKAKPVDESGEIIFSDDFSDDELDTDYWIVREGVQILDGKLTLGKGDNWIAGGYAANFIPEDDYIENYVLDFDFEGDKRDCYYGFGIRAPGNCASEFNNGGRYGVPQASELGCGIAFDLLIKPQAGKLGVALNDGGEWGEAAQFMLTFPTGYDGSSGHVRLVDLGDLVTLYINGKEIVTLVLGNEEVTAYNSAGEEVFKGDAEFPDEGTFGFYQRNDLLTIDNVVVREFKEGTASTEPTQPDQPDEPDEPVAQSAVVHISRDQLMVDGADRAEFGGNKEVTDVDLLADVGKELKIWGWVGTTSAIKAFGYRINGVEKTDESFFYPAGDDVVNAATAMGATEASRFAIMVPITEGTYTVEAFVTTDAGTETIWTVNVSAGQGQTPVVTGDATMILFIVAAAAVVLVILKKRAF